MTDVLPMLTASTPFFLQDAASRYADLAAICLRPPRSAACTAIERLRIISPVPDVNVAEPSTTSPERLFLEHLDVVERIVAIIARRNTLAPSDAEEFGSWARGRLIDSDYAILRKFGGRSSMATYLSVVLSNLFRDFRNARWGRWRPSAAAVRLGPIGIRLDELLHRDGCTLREAIGMLRSTDAGLSDVELARTAARLPYHGLNREVQLDAGETMPASHAPDIDHAVRERINVALEAAIATLSDEERVITRMRYWEGTSIAEIARALRIEQKPLYRRLIEIQNRLRSALERDGIGEAQARDILEDTGAW